MSKPLIEDGYLGDGVYASFDGYHVCLDLRDQDSTTKIALEPYVLNALDKYRAEIARRQKRRAPQKENGS